MRNVGAIINRPGLQRLSLKECGEVLEIELEKKGYPLNPRFTMMAHKHYMKTDIIKLLRIVKICNA